MSRQMVRTEREVSAISAARCSARRADLDQVEQASGGAWGNLGVGKLGSTGGCLKAGQLTDYCQLGANTGFFGVRGKD